MIAWVAKAGGWRRVIAGVLTYAIVLQGLATAVVGARRAADAAGNPDVTFELCRHLGASDSGTSDDGPPGNPAPAPDTHCVFCLAGSHHALDVPAISPAYQAVTVPLAPWRFTAWRLPTPTVDANARPRGPPPAA